MRGILVGMGGRAQSWAQVCGRNPEVELVGFVEPVESQREAIAEKLGLPADRLYTRLTDAIKGCGADFALDVTPPAAHETVAEEALDGGLHVLGEKPLSDDFAAARRIVAAAEKARRTHMVTQNYRFGPVPRTTRRLLASGSVGLPRQVAVGFYRAWATRLGTHYTTMPYPLLTDMGIHHFDLLRYVTGQEPERVTARSWNPKWGWHAGDASHTAFIEFTGGLVATHHSCGCSVGKQSPWNGDWRIDGPEGSITWEEDRIFITREHPPDQKQRDEIPLDTLPLTGQDALLDEFVRAVKENREPECSGRDNLRSLALTFATVQSAREGGRTVEIQELLS